MDVFELAAKITLDNQEYENKLKDSSNSTESFANKLGSGLSTAAKVGAAALAAASGAVVAFAKSALDAGGAFDSSMSQVAATMGFSVAELQDKSSQASQTMQQLRDFAQQMGSTTAFSASEAADALNYMALAGYDAATSMDMLPTILNLAAAGGIELATASDMVTDVQSALGLTLEETTAMVDQMAKASSKSNTSVSQLGDALLTIGATAANVAGGTQELTTVLGALADNGIKGSEGGTHLRNMILSLQDAVSDGVVDFGKFSVALYDADGNMRNTVDIIKDMQKNMQGMTQAEKDAVVSGIFNKTDLASINALLNTSAERFDELGAQIEDSTGAAQAMAEVQLDNLEGDVTLFQSALEGAQIVVSESLTPSMREFVQFGSDGLSRLTTSFKEGGLSGAMNTLGDLISEGLAMIIQKLPEVIKAGMELLKAFGKGIIDNMPVIIDATFQIMEMITTEVLNNLPMIIESGLKIIVQLAEGIAQALPEMIPTIVDVIITIVENLIDNVDMLIDASIEIIFALAEGLINALPKLIEKAPVIIAKLADAIVRNAPKLLEAGLKLMLTLGEALIKYIPKLLAKVPEVVTNLKNKYIELVKSFTDIGKNIVDGIWNGISAGWKWLTDKVSGLVDGLVGGVKGLLGINSPSKVFASIGGFMAEGLGEGWNDEFSNVQKDINKNLSFEAGNISVTSSGSVATTNGLSQIEALLQKYLPEIGSGQLVLDTGVLVGELTPSIDKQLGFISALRR